MSSITKIDEVQITAPTWEIDITDISQDYDDLWILASLISDDSADVSWNLGGQFRWNGISTNYERMAFNWYTTTEAVAYGTANANGFFPYAGAQSVYPNDFGKHEILINNYTTASTNYGKCVMVNGTRLVNSSTLRDCIAYFSSSMTSSGPYAITSLRITTVNISTFFYPGSHIEVYGLANTNRIP